MRNKINFDNPWKDLEYTFNDRSYTYTINITAEDIENFLGKISDTVYSFLDFDKLEDDEDFIESLKDYHEEEARAAFDDESEEETLEAAIELKDNLLDYIDSKNDDELDLSTDFLNDFFNTQWEENIKPNFKLARRAGTIEQARDLFEKEY